MKDKDIEKVKCGNCGFLNIKGTRKCVKCNMELKQTKTCPKCAKRNKIDAVKCVNCNYKFSKVNRNKKNLLFNLLVSFLLVIILSLLIYFEHTRTLSSVKNILKIVAVIFIFGLLYRTINYGAKDINKFSAEEEILDDSRFDLLRKISNIAIIIGTIIVIIFLIYYYFIK